MNTSKITWRIIRLFAINICYQIIIKISRYPYLHKLISNIEKWYNQFNWKQYIGYILATSCIILSYSKINELGGLRFEQYLFFLIMPFTLRRNRGIGNVIPLFLISAVLLVTFYITYVYSIFYFGVCMSILTCLAITVHQPTYLSILLGLVTTPAVKYLLSIFSFPLRLKLTEVSGTMLKPFIDNLNIAGNCIYIDGIEFTVAPECLGLNMVTSSLVFAIFTLSFFSQRFKMKPRLPFSIVFILLTLTLIVVVNLTRITLTVFLKAMPGTLLHELIGILLFIINCCLLLFAIGTYSKRYYKNIIPKQKRFKEQHYLSLLVAPLLIIGSYNFHENHVKPQFDSSPIEIEGFNKSVSKDGVIKLQNETGLVYVKPPAFMLGSDHNPFICWRASGYKIKTESLQKVDDFSVYTFELHKPNEEPLYSCWWYSNGKSNTINQFKWRLSTIKGENAFSVINVTAASKEKSLKLTKRILSENLL